MTAPPPDPLFPLASRSHHSRPNYGARFPMALSEERTGWVKVTVDGLRGPRVYRADSFAEAARKLPATLTAIRFEWVKPST